MKERKEIYLTPPFSVPDLGLVLQMSVHFGLAGQGPHQTSSIWRGVLLGRLHPDVVGLMDSLSGFVHRRHQQLHESVHDQILCQFVLDFESVIEENVSWGLLKEL